jgi:translation initiation factor 2 alpha subunit (eIF-2alpha)
MQAKRHWLGAKTVAEDEEDPWESRRDELSDDAGKILETPFGDAYEWRDPLAKAREELLGEEGEPQRHMKKILAERYFNCPTWHVDAYYTLEDIEEAVASLQVESEIQDRDNWKAEQKAKTTTR